MDKLRPFLANVCENLSFLSVDQQFGIWIKRDGDALGTLAWKIWMIALVDPETLAAPLHVVEIEVGNLLLADQLSSWWHAKRLATLPAIVEHAARQKKYEQATIPHSPMLPALGNVGNGDEVRRR